MKEKIGNVTIAKIAVLLAIVSAVFYVIFKDIVVSRLMNSSIAVRIVKENAMDKEYRDKTLKQMYESYQQKMHSRQ